MDKVPALDNTFGAAFIGLIFASVLYGVSCSQMLDYFNNNSHDDPPGIKNLVVATWISDTIHQALISHTVYTYLVTCYFQPQQLGELVWSLLVEVIFNGITALLVQCYFAHRIWKFSHGRLCFAVPLGTFIFGEFAAVIAYVAKSLPMKTFVQLATLKPLSMLVNILAVAADVLITLVSCYLLYTAKNSVPSTSAMINRLITFTLQTGMLTSLCAIASLFFICILPNTFIYIGFYFQLGRLYCNSLLATLNIRREILNERTKNSSFPPHPSRSPNPPSVDENGVIGSALTLSPRSSRPEDSSETINLKVFRRSIGPHSPSSSIPGSAPKLGSGDQGSIAKDKDPPFEGSFELSISKLV